MGWFLSRHKKTKRPRRKPATASSGGGASAGHARPWNPARMLLALKLLAAAAVIVGAVVAWRYGERALLAYTADAHGGPVAVDDVTLAHVPTWMRQSPWVSREIARTVADTVSSDPLDGASLRRAAAKLRENPWIAQVVQVHRLAGGKVVVEAAYRTPVAFIRANDGYHLVDARGVMLTQAYEPYQVSKVGLPVVTGVKQAPPRVGQPWPGHAVTSALSLVLLLERQAWSNQIKAYHVLSGNAADVPALPGAGVRLQLVTAHGLVRWGPAPGEEPVGHPGAATKLNCLASLVRQTGTIDDRGKVVDLLYGDVRVTDSAVTGDASLSAYSW